MSLSLANLYKIYYFQDLEAFLSIYKPKPLTLIVGDVMFGSG
jgi:hypothetical protein